MGKAVDIAGERYGNLVAISPTAKRQGNTIVWLCRCDCGRMHEAGAASLRIGNTKSCGCLQPKTTAQRNYRHGMRRTPMYRIWLGMKERCLNPGYKQYESYGGRGINVCARWSSDFMAFLADMGERPSPKHSLDRIDNDKGYEPGNVRWATPAEQTRNTRRNRYIEADGQRLTIEDWSQKTGIPSRLISLRINRLGWTERDAVLVPRFAIGVNRRFADPTFRRSV